MKRFSQNFDEQNFDKLIAGLREEKTLVGNTLMNC